MASFLVPADLALIWMLNPSSMTSHMVNLPHGWYPHTRSFFATLQSDWLKLGAKKVRWLQAHEIGRSKLKNVQWIIQKQIYVHFHAWNKCEMNSLLAYLQHTKSKLVLALAKYFLHCFFSQYIFFPLYIRIEDIVKYCYILLKRHCTHHFWPLAMHAYILSHISLISHWWSFTILFHVVDHLPFEVISI